MFVHDLLQITDKCLPSIFELQYLEDLVLEGCFSIDDDSLSAFKQGCKSLKVESLCFSWFGSRLPVFLASCFNHILI